MKLSRRQLRLLIETFLTETRAHKKAFSIYRDKYNLSSMFYVHWTDEADPNSLQRFLDKIESGTEVSANLIKRNETETGPHLDTFGNLGIVFQGIPTMGSNVDLKSQFEDTPSGKRLRFDDDQDYIRWGDITITPKDKLDSEFILPDLNPESDYTPDDAKRRKIDLGDQKNASIFSDDVDNITGVGHSEYFVVPKKIVGIVIHDSDSNPYGWSGRENEDTATIRQLGKLSSLIGVSFASGKDILPYFRSLY